MTWSAVDAVGAVHARRTVLGAGAAVVAIAIRGVGWISDARVGAKTGRSGRQRWCRWQGRRTRRRWGQGRRPRRARGHARQRGRSPSACDCPRIVWVGEDISGVEQPIRGGGADAGDGVGRGKATEHSDGLCGRQELATLPQLHHRPRNRGSRHRRARIRIGRAVGQRSRREHARAGREDVHARSVVRVRGEGVGGRGGTDGDRVGRARWRGRARVLSLITRRHDDHHASSVRGRDCSILG